MLSPRFVRYRLGPSNVRVAYFTLLFFLITTKTSVRNRDTTKKFRKFRSQKTSCVAMFHFSGFNMMFPDGGRSFQATYKCFSVSMLPGNERSDVEKGGKSK